MTRQRRFGFLLTAGCLLLTVLLAPDSWLLAPVFGQSASATLSGTVVDANGAAIPGATITVTEPATGVERTTTTNDLGYFTIPLLKPSTYLLHVEHQGFLTAEVRDIVLNVNDQRALTIKMKVGDVKETVNITGEAPLINESPAVGTVVDRQFVGNLPLNGRSFQSLITLSPGVVLTKASAFEPGQFSVNGQRSDSNYFTVDGVSANLGVSGGVGLGEQAGGTSPGLTVLGGTNNLVSVDALQEFRIQTSTFAPEFGRQPGAQIQILTRSGTNRFSGTVFEYFRNDALDANDWFNNALRLRKAAERQHDFGGVLGGPIMKDRTFFFFSYEGLRLRLPRTAITDVPSLSARQDPRASTAIRQLLNGFPSPNGPETGGGFAQFAASFSNPSTLNAVSIRLDHTVNNRLSLFGRYNAAPSETMERAGAGSSLNTIFPTKANTRTFKGGATWVITESISKDFRANYSRVASSLSFLVDNFGGAVRPPDSLLFPSGSSGDTVFTLQLANGRQGLLCAGLAEHERLRQFNVVNNLSIITGSHEMKFGIDYSRLTTFFDPGKFQEFVLFGTVNQAISGFTTLIGLQSRYSAIISFDNFSAFAQDTWKITRRLTLTYGLRWDVNTPPRGSDLAAFTGLENPSALKLAPKGTPLWETVHSNFAPRIGIAYQLSRRQGRETVIRGGFGIFYDLGTAGANDVLNVFPYGRQNLLVGEPFPSANAIPIPFSLNPPFGTNVAIFDPELKLPRTYQWNFALEHSLGTSQSISASYVGAAGRRLLRREQLNNPNPNIASANITRNTAASDYHALQLQFQRRLSRGLQALASYTWSKSLDNGSSDFVKSIPSESADPRADRGPRSE